MTFIKLTPLKEGAPQVLVNPAFIVCIGQMPDQTMVTLVNSDELVPVRESPAEILALLAEQRTVTHAMHTAAINEAAARSWYVSQKLIYDLRAILEAALAVSAEK